MWRWGNSGIAGDRYFGTHNLLEAFANYDRAEIRLLEYHSGAQQPLRIPVFVVGLSGVYSEAYSPYGFSTIDIGQVPLAYALPLLRAFLRDNKIVGLFLRHDPWNQSHASLVEPETVQVGEVFSLDLTTFSKDDSDNMARVPQKRRSLVRRAINEGLETSIVPARNATEFQRQAFEHLYQQTMVRNGAKPYYFFDSQFFDCLFGAESNNLVLVEVSSRQADTALSSALFVLGPDFRVHYFLSGSCLDGRGTGASDFVIYRAAVHFSENGYRLLNMGGATSISGDGLRAFKKGWSSRSDPYFVTKLICDDEGYRAVEASLPNPRPELFLLHQQSRL